MARPKHVLVVDTNAIHSNYRFTDLYVEYVFKVAKLGRLELAVPRIVLDEFLGQFRRTVTENLSALRRESKIFEKLTGSQLKNKQAISSKSVDRYVTSLRRDFTEKLNASNGRMVEVPKHSLLSVAVDKALDSRRPFREHGKGIFDAGIWEVVKVELSNDHITVFVTSDNDFRKRNSESLHSDLVSEVEELGFKSDQIVLVRSFKEYVEQFLFDEVFSNQMEKKYKKHRTQIATGIQGWIDTQIPIRVGNGLFRAHGELDRLKPDEIWLESASLLDYVEFVRAVKDYDGEAIVEIEAEIEGLFEFGMWRSEYYDFDARSPGFLSRPVDDDDSHYVRCEAHVTVSFMVEARVKIDDFSLEELSVTFGDSD